MKKLLLSLFFASTMTLFAQTPPDWSVTDCEGETYTLSELIAQGKTVTLDIGAQWCGPCQSAAPAMQDIYELYGENQEDVIILGWLIQDYSQNNSTCNTIEEWDTDLGLSYPSAPAQAGDVYNGTDMNAILTEYNVTGIPFFITFVPDPENPGEAMVAYNSAVDSGSFTTGIQNALTAYGYQEGGVKLNNEEFSLTNIFSVYPNPAQDVLNIEASSSVEIESISIYSIRGEVVKTINSEVKSIQISDLTTGIYFVEVKHKDGIQKVKFIKS